MLPKCVARKRIKQAGYVGIIAKAHSASRKHALSVQLCNYVVVALGAWFWSVPNFMSRTVGDDSSKGVPPKPPAQGPKPSGSDASFIRPAESPPASAKEQLQSWSGKNPRRVPYAFPCKTNVTAPKRQPQGAVQETLRSQMQGTLALAGMAL